MDALPVEEAVEGPGGTVLEEDRGGVRWVVLARAESHNAIDLPTARAWSSALAKARGDGTVRAVVLAGEGPSFCSGGDLRAFREAEDRRGYLSSVAKAVGEGVVHITSMDKPVVAAVHGNAMGVGFSMFLATDYKLVAEGTRMAMSYINVGLTPGGGGTWLLPRLVGAARATEMLLLGDAVDAHEAMEMGIVNRVVAQGELLAEAQAMAERLSGQPPGTLGGTKRLIWTGLASPLPVQLALEADAIGLAAAGPEFEEGSATFFQRRRPGHR